MISILSIFLTLVGSYVFVSFVAFVRNWKKAGHMGFRRSAFPVLYANMLWTTVHSYGITGQLIDLLPQPLADIINESSLKNRWTIGARRAKAMGKDVYLVVAPGGNTLEVHEASVTAQVFSARQNFLKPHHQYELMTLYGQNLATCDDRTWPRHRKHTGPAFNEKIFGRVWSETIEQSMGMQESWNKRATSTKELAPVRTAADLMKLTLQVISGAAYGVHIPFNPTDRKATSNEEEIFHDSGEVPKGYHASFRDVIYYMTSPGIFSVLMAVMVLPKWVPRSLVPFLEIDFQMYHDLRKYLHSLVDVAKSGHVDSRGGNDLLRQIVGSNPEPGSNSKEEEAGFTPDEILGNLFMMTLAGHETTSTTLHYCLILMAMNPEQQDWLLNGMDEALEGEPEDPSEWSYETVYPKLLTPLCAMLETIRLFPPAPAIPKWTWDTTATLTFDNERHTLPPETFVTINITSLHYSAEYWGPDVREFRPDRWDRRNKESFLAQNEGMPNLSAPGLEHNNIHKPVRGAFVPFSDGTRACIGKKFAQVEFVGALSAIFRRYRVELYAEPGKAWEDAREHAKEVLDTSRNTLSLCLPKGTDIPLRLIKR